MARRTRMHTVLWGERRPLVHSLGVPLIHALQGGRTCCRMAGPQAAPTFLASFHFLLRLLAIQACLHEGSRAAQGGPGRSRRPFMRPQFCTRCSGAGAQSGSVHGMRPWTAVERPSVGAFTTPRHAAAAVLGVMRDAARALGFVCGASGPACSGSQEDEEAKAR